MRKYDDYNISYEIIDGKMYVWKKEILHLKDDNGITTEHQNEILINNFFIDRDALIKERNKQVIDIISYENIADCKKLLSKAILNIENLKHDYIENSLYDKKEDTQFWEETKFTLEKIINK